MPQQNEISGRVALVTGGASSAINVSGGWYLTP
jgi:hypothetical protein